ncbi:hypothetical protein AAY473_039724 [Plecturocebus cupreus]
MNAPEPSKELIYIMLPNIKYAAQGTTNLMYVITHGIQVKQLQKLRKQEYRSKQVTIKFDVCAAINSNKQGLGCGSLAWERSYMAEHKYICHNRWRCSGRCDYWPCVTWAIWKNNKNDPVCLQKGRSISSCTSGHCNQLELTITNPLDPCWRKGESVIMGIDGKGLDPVVNILIWGDIQR